MTESMIYEGKAKKIFSTDKSDQVRVFFKDSLTAFNAQKKGSFTNKGAINRDIASLLFQALAKEGVSSHWLRDLGTSEMIVKKLSIIPLEVVVRNILAGSTAKKLGIDEGRVLARPLVEFYFKDDALGDPFVSDDQILMLGCATEAELSHLKKEALKVNGVLQKLFLSAGLTLVDFKIEFGKDQSGKILLADEITPDCCRLWDVKTKEKFDKDRFRRDLGGVDAAYESVLQRLKEMNK